MANSWLVLEHYYKTKTIQINMTIADFDLFMIQL